MSPAPLGIGSRRGFRGDSLVSGGAWDARTLGEMLALRFGTPRGRSVLFQGLRRFLTRDRGVFIVLDNHEDDRAMARLLDELRDAHATWVITARRCLLWGCRFFRSPRPS